MKILHISDIHIGAKLGRFSQNNEIKKCLDFILSFCEQAKINLLVIAGDIFDTYNPSSDSEEIYFNFLNNLSNLNIYTVIIGGNHDNHERLLAPANFLKLHNIFVFGTRYEKNFIFYHNPIDIRVGSEEISIVPIPYINENALISTAELVDNQDEMIKNFSAKVKQHIDNLILKSKFSNKILIMHAYVLGGKLSNSEKNIQKGNSLLIDISEISKDFSYCALGHLHRCQKILDNAYYSGSIIPISIDEGAYKKYMLLIEINNNQSFAEKIELPSFAQYFNLKGKVCEIINQLENINNSYVSIIFNEPLTLELQAKINKIIMQNDIKLVTYGFEFLNSNDFINFKDFEIEKILLKEDNLSFVKLFEEFVNFKKGFKDNNLINKFQEIIDKLNYKN